MQAQHHSIATRGKAAGALALITAALVAASPGSHAANAPEPLPPPPELTTGVAAGGVSYPASRYGGGTRNFSRPQDAPYDPYATPASSYLPPLPNTPAAEYPQSQQGLQSDRAGVSVPHMQAPPMTALPSGGFAVSPPASSMPEDYFNLPLVEAGGIPGIVMPEYNDEFYDPGMYDPATGKRIIQPGLGTRQLEPFFDLAKGCEKAALDARRVNDEYTYRMKLKEAVDGYMEIISMADASTAAREEAWYGVARCEYRRENWWRAFDALERSFPTDFVRAEVEGRVKLEMFIGERMWRLGHSHVPGASQDGVPLSGYEAADRVYMAAIFNQPGAKDAPLALLRRGDAAAMNQNWNDAARFYRTVVQYYPESEAAMQARSSLAEAVYRQEWPAGMPESARVDLATVMDDVENAERRLSMPAEERRRRAVVLANDLEATNKLRQAKDYMTKMRVKKSRDAAVFLLGDVVSHYPDTEQAREAADLLRDMGIEPPMKLSDGSRFPLAPPSPETTARNAARQAARNGAGSVRVDGQDDEEPQPRNQINYSPAPELRYTPTRAPNVAAPGSPLDER
ncbi:MAG: hypothetical protein LUC93_18955 [Planctomycetaceae bacterium]|nr:hypothetical protein [Planctomycetaceae bacterium]